MTNQILIRNNDPSTFPNETSCVESISVVDTLDVTRDLDVFLDCACCADKVYYVVLKYGYISRYLPPTTKERVINALITSRIDYCNSLLYNTSANNISRLQRMHNAAARLILCRPRTDSATPLLRKLHWLPVARRIQYKILLLCYKITHRHVPFYLRDLLPSYQPTRCLRSSTSNSLVVPRTRGKAGDAAFAVAAPRLWNALPHALKCVVSINIFKNNLKTHLFTLEL